VNGLDLFSGIGGITLALQEWVTPVAYCEIDEYARNVLLSRMLEGKLPVAPIWDDVKSLKGDMLPEIDIIYGGFPCQDISVAGKQKGLEGERSGLFYEIMRLAEEVKPAFIFLENVPNIRTKGLDTVGGELATRGYDCRWGIVSAQEMGAPHKRERWFCLAHTKCKGKWSNARTCSCSEKERKELQQEDRTSLSNDSNKACSTVANTKCLRPQGQGEHVRSLHTEKNQDGETSGANHGCEDIQDAWDIEPAVGRVANGVPNRVDRIKCLGNAVVPIQAREAFMRLMKDIL